MKNTHPNPGIRAGITAGWISIVVNTLLFGLKYWAGIVTGSVAIIADAWHTMSDSISSVIVLISIRISRKPADREHPFGHGRADLVASLFIGVILGVVAINFLIESVQKLIQHESVQFGNFALIVIIISIILKEFLAQFSFWAGRKTHSTALKADAWHHRSDALSSILILIGIFLDDLFWWIDGVLGILVTLFLLQATYKILQDSIGRILGEKPDEELIISIQDICTRASSAPIHPHHIHLHRYGKHTELTLHIYLPKEQSLEEAHNIATDIEDLIRKELDIEATIHMEPMEE